MSPSSALESLFEEVREQCSRTAWSRGVELARAGAVAHLGDDDGERVVRVAVPGAPVSPTVRLSPTDLDWHCDCPDAEDPCLHVAAAVIALRRAAKEDRPELVAHRACHVRHVLRRRGERLALERQVVTPEGEAVPMPASLGALVSGRVAGPEVAATQADYRVDDALGPRGAGVELPAERMARLLAALSQCADVWLEDERVQASGEPLRPRARLEDRDGGFWLGFVQDEAVRERFANGVARVGDTLRPLAGTAGLLGRHLEMLERGRRFEPDEVPALVGDVLPAIEDTVDLDMRSQRLPRAEREPPRIRVEVTREGDALSVLPTLVYGDPPRARVDAGRLVHLGGNVPLRDEAAERHAMRTVQQTLGVAPGHRVVLSGREAVDFAERLRDWPGEVRGGAHRDFTLAAPLVPKLTLRGADFGLAFESPADGNGNGGRPRRASSSAVLRAWREGEELVPLAGGGFAPLPADWLGRYGSVLADLLAAREQAGALPACALPDLARLCEALGEPPPPDFERLRSLLGDFAGLPEPALPDDLRATLRDYQRAGVRWLAFLRDAGLGALLADDMGLGKTLQTLCVLEGRSLVVAPTSVLFNWADEIARFRPGLRTCLYHGPRRTLDPDADVVLTTYALLRLDAERLQAEDWDCAVLDEAQNVKNPDSQVARAAYGLRARFRVALSGTPVENRLDELWSQLHFLNPGLLGSRADFQERYARPIATDEPEAAVRLRRRIRPFVLRRRKHEVARELPPRSDMVLHCELDEEERAVYDAIRAATQRDVVARLRAGGSVLEALEALLRLRQCACHAGLVPGHQAERSSKLELLREELETVVADGHRALVFSQWTALLDRTEPVLQSMGVDFLRLDGSTRDRAGVVGRFQAAGGPPVLLVSLRAGGTGLNLTAADHVFLLDPWWNPAVEDQAADRTHRIGQERPVMVYRLVARDTVESRILALQDRKRALADAALGDAGGAAGLSREDLLSLLE